MKTERHRSWLRRKTHNDQGCGETERGGRTQGESRVDKLTLKERGLHQEHVDEPDEYLGQGEAAQKIKK